MVRTIINWVVIVFTCFILQTTLVSSIAIFGVKPDLIMVVLFMLAVKTGILPGICVGFILGLGQDLYSPTILGQNALAKTLTGFFAGLFNEKIMRIDPVLQIVLLIVAFLLNDIVFMTIQILKTNGSMQVIGPYLVTFTLPRAVYSLFFAAIPFIWDNFFKDAFRR